MKSVVRPELPTASVGSMQPGPQSTYKSGEVVQTTGATSQFKISSPDLFTEILNV